MEACSPVARSPRLSVEDAIACRALARRGVPREKIAELFGTTPRVVRDAANGNRWRNLLASFDAWVLAAEEQIPEDDPRREAIFGMLVNR